MRRNTLILARIVLLAGMFCSCGVAEATQLLLKDGRILQGRLGMTGGLANRPEPMVDGNNDNLQLIIFLDDDLRRTYVSTYQKKALEPGQPGEIVERYRLPQRVMESGPSIRSVGPAVRVQPFDEFGRRIYTMNTVQGQIDIIQGITELTPTWLKVEGQTHIWEMRLATSSLPRETLAKILANQTDPKDIEQRKRVARFYLQAERYEEASAELQAILRDFPDPAIKQQLEPSLRAVRRLSATRLLQELTLRRQAGQYRLVLAALEKLPADDLPGDSLETVRTMLSEYESYSNRRKELLAQFDGLLEKVKEAAIRDRIAPIRKEMGDEINTTTIARLSAFRQMADDPSLLPQEKLSLAISGWLLGETSASVKLPVAMSAFDVRALVREYLNTPEKIARAEILEKFHSQEASSPATVAKIIAAMKPPVETAAPPVQVKRMAVAEEKSAEGKRFETKSAHGETPKTEPVPGFFELEVPGRGPASPTRYFVQLPPEYDPLKRYPAVVTLRGAGSTAEYQIEWWAGAWDGSVRRGQASRYGYIVIAPDWLPEHQKEYGYSAAEHAAVLDSLRDACKRFSIDTDHVFLSGHSIGGDAAWDIGLAHPDLWAGIIPFCARSAKYGAFYWEHARMLPVYWVCGELDGGQLVANSRDLDRCLTRGFNLTIVEYLGRGHESFSDEVLRIFDWMGRFKRDFFPKEFQGITMRPWDNFFFWLEMSDLPPRSIVHPADWPPGRGTQPASFKGRILANNGLNVAANSGRVTVWLSPEMLDFQRRMSITVQGKAVSLRGSAADGDLETLLEDVRTRGDRQHPFWAKVEANTGRVLNSK